MAEDLIAEASGLHPRIELGPATDPVVLGLKRTGGFCVYFGEEPVLQFDAEDRLRRVFVDGLLYRTQGTTLAQLTRHRTATAHILERHDLDDGELAELLARLHATLTALWKDIIDQKRTVLRAVPESSTIPEVLTEPLRRIVTEPLRLAPSIIT